MLLDNRTSKTKNLTVEEIDAIPAETKIEPIPVQPQEVPQPVVVQEEKEKTVEDVLKDADTQSDERREVDYKEKFKESTRESLSLHFKNEKLANLLETNLEVAEPTEVELKKYASDMGGDWDEMDSLSRNILKKTVLGERREEKRSEVVEEMRSVEKWGKKVEEFIGLEENLARYPSLEGQEDAFKKFCMVDSRRASDINDLVGSFLFHNDKLPEKKTKAPILLSQGNGRVESPKPAGVSAEEAGMYRIKDSKEYRKLIKAGKIRIEI
jgi:hypothetical protein